jgi:hypothetical protein
VLASDYVEIYEGTQGSDLSVETRNIPREAFLAPANYSLKFEISLLASLTGASMRIYLGNDNGSAGGDFGAARNTYFYLWKPNLKTLGAKWQTVTIPWADVFAANSKNASPPFVYNSAGYGMGILFQGPSPTPVTYNFAIDNMRVVPN